MEKETEVLAGILAQAARRAKGAGVILAAAWLACCPWPACAADAREAWGTVERAKDGDTLAFRMDSGERADVRLAGIDAPEKRQAWGKPSAQELSALAGQRALLVWKKTDRYGRIVGKVMAGKGCSKEHRETCADAGLRQVKLGLAWHYKKYEKEQDARDRAGYGRAEEEARRAHLGLWSIPEPVAPWDFRKGQGR